MRVLAISDEPSAALWSPQVKERLEGIDLILSCGDLPGAYLEYLVTLTDIPLVYVPGNHDNAFADDPPGGCICADDRIVTVNGLRILGLGGSIRYNLEGIYQYTQQEMLRRAWKLGLSMRANKGFDILLTHAGGLGIGDGEDHAHEGFEVFNRMLEHWSPAYMVHGHTHLNYSIKQKRVSRYGSTQVINAFGRYVFEI